METNPRRLRAEPPDVTALRVVAQRQPALASAVDMQIELLSLQHRVEVRLSTAWMDVDEIRVAGRLAAGLPVLRFEDIPFEWTEFRLFFRQVADLLRRFELLEPSQYEEIQRRVRSGRPTESEVARWFSGDSGRGLAPDTPAAEAADLDESVAQVMEIAARPFLAKIVATTAGRLDVSSWRRSSCPYCGGAPEMAVWVSDGDGRLACGRCAGTWRYDPRACALCGNDVPGTLTSFTSPDRVYRLTACDRCGRYLKAYDVTVGQRPLMLPVDTIATLPLDAAAQQRGYQP